MSPRWRHRIGKLARLRRREWSDLLQAQAFLAWAQLLVWTRPSGRLVELHAQEVSDLPARLDEPRQATPQRARELALAISRAAQNGVFRPTCLVRSVALERLLALHGMPGGRIRIGIRRASGRFTAHAWVELGGAVVGDLEQNVGRYVRLSEARLISS